MTAPTTPSRIERIPQYVAAAGRKIGSFTGISDIGNPDEIIRYVGRSKAALTAAVAVYAVSRIYESLKRFEYNESDKDALDTIKYIALGNIVPDLGKFATGSFLTLFGINAVKARNARRAAAAVTVATGP